MAGTFDQFDDTDGFTRGGRRERVTLASPLPVQTPGQLALEQVMRAGHQAAVLRLRLSQIEPRGPQSHHVRVARCLLDDAAAEGGHVFTCGDGDLVLIASPAAVANVGATTLRLYRPEMPGPQPVAEFWTLPADAAEVRRMLAVPTGRAGPVREAPVPLGAIASVAACAVAAPAGALLRRQRAVRIDGSRLRPMFDEISVCLTRLESRIGMRAPEGADPYLAHYLAGQLDGHMLQAIAAADHGGVQALHLKLPLAVASLPGFTALRATLRDAGLALGVELRLLDAASDVTRFVALRDRLQADGCTVLLGGIEPHMLGFCDPAELRPDLLKLEWSAALATLPPRQSRHLIRAIEAAGPERIVLDRADTEAAVVWGRAQGISAFQGRHVDAMLAAERLARCAWASACSLRQCLDRAAATDPDGRDGCANPALLGGVLHLAGVPQPGVGRPELF